MSKFNSATVARNKTVNLAGGQAFKQTSKLEFISIMLTSFLKDQFYRTEAQTVTHLRALLDGIDLEFAAKAAIYARREFGMRSVTHFIAAEIGQRAKGKEWTRPFFQRIVRRPDDLLEILACHQQMTSGGPIPNAMKRGFAAALSSMDEHALAKYRKDGADWSMIDAVNLCRPKATPALTALMKGTLAPAETWETKLTQAGQSAETDEEKADLKAEQWAALVTEKKLGYMALVRNLRNILTHAPQVVDQVCEQLVDADAIKRSLMFPFRFLTAIDIMESGNLDGAGAGKVIRALNKAVDLSLANVPKFEGRTLIALDESGSMNSFFPGKQTPAKIGALFAATLLKANPDSAALLTFAERSRFRTVNVDDSTLTVARSIAFNGGGTNFHSIFEKLTVKYDRIIILSDMQGWIGGNTPTQSFNQYCFRLHCRPRIYSFDLQGYGSMQFPEPEVYCLAGFSDKVFDIMALFETDKQALVHKVEAVELG